MLLSSAHVGGDQRCQHNAGEGNLEGYGGAHRGLSNAVVARLWCVLLSFIRSFQFMAISNRFVWYVPCATYTLGLSGQYFGISASA
jgi:hypothetical protein